MKKYIIKQLRERASVKGKEKTWVSECSDEQLYQLFQKLRVGESAKSIAQYVQKAWKVNPKSTVHSISQGVLKFRKRIEDLLELGFTEQTAPNLPKTLSDSSGPFDDLMALERLVRLQRDRIEKMMKEERELGVKHPSMSRDVLSLAALEKILIKEKEFAIKHAHEDPIKRRENEIRSKRIEHNFNTWMANTTDESREVMVNAIDKFLVWAEENAIPMVLDEETGKYRPVEEEGFCKDKK